MFRISISGPKPGPSTEYLHLNKHYKLPKAFYNCSRKFCSLTHAQTHVHSRVHPQKVWVATCCTPNPSPLAAVQVGGLLPLAQLEGGGSASRETSGCITPGFNNCSPRFLPPSQIFMLILCFSSSTLLFASLPVTDQCS